MYEGYQKKSAQKNSKESKSATLGEVLFVAWHEESFPLTELYVDGHFTEDREEWQKEFQRHREEVYTDQGETKEVKKKGSVFFFLKKGNQQFTVDGRNAEITVDLVLQARPK